MRRTPLRFLTVLSAIVVLSSARSGRAAQSCNQTDLAPGSTGTVSVLLPDTAQGLQPKLTARDAGKKDPWGPCPTADPFGACRPDAHSTTSTVSVQKVLDPDDGMQLLEFQMKNAAGAPARTVRLCVQYQ